MTNLRDLLKAARREQSTVHQMHLPDGSRVTTTHSTGPATHELIALAPQLAAALIKAEKALASIAANSCCDGCQEAALVARTALTALREERWK